MKGKERKKRGKEKWHNGKNTGNIRINKKKEKRKKERKWAAFGIKIHDVFPTEDTKSS